MISPNPYKAAFVCSEICFVIPLAKLHNPTDLSIPHAEPT